jgi:hypothetical protein
VIGHTRTSEAAGVSPPLSAMIRYARLIVVLARLATKASRITHNKVA